MAGQGTAQGQARRTTGAAEAKAACHTPHRPDHRTGQTGTPNRL